MTLKTPSKQPVLRCFEGHFLACITVDPDVHLLDIHTRFIAIQYWNQVLTAGCAYVVLPLILRGNDPQNSLFGPSKQPIWSVIPSEDPR
jgi:hypothetical protein